MSDQPVALLALILLTASLVAMLTRRLRLPYSIGLVAAGIGLGALPNGFNVPLSHDLIYSVFLPPLVFEAALQLEWSPFRRDLPATVLLAFPGVALATTVVAVGVHLILGWSLLASSLFGALIAATDPVSVIAAFKEMRVEPRLSLIVEAESLLNDGAAAVLFGVLSVMAHGSAASTASVALSLVWTIAGGVATGGVVTWLLLLIAGRTEDHLVEITLTTIAAYGSFLIAEHVGASGVLATLTAGLLVGNFGWRRIISEIGRGHVLSFWQYAAFLANSVVFILIGGLEARQPFGAAAWAIIVSILLVLLSRALAVYPLCGALRPTRLRIPLAYQHVLFWGGLRGALALALALALPDTLAERQVIIVTAFAVVAFSIFIQGLTMPILVARLKIPTRADTGHHLAEVGQERD